VVLKNYNFIYQVSGTSLQGYIYRCRTTSYYSYW